ncbi:MAG: hypothetical protein KGD57_01570 [Candidatus Lokiarchaeota archaeon]|nr:hypothetical protein [Candidatus Lokiarchaeota archaeon]
MFNIEDFQDYSALLPNIKKLNKFLQKEKNSSISSQIEELKNLLEDDNLKVPITYILSILAEEKSDLFDFELIERIEPLIYSDNIKLKLNSISILGFFILSRPEQINKKYFSLFTELLTTQMKDIRENCYYFLQKMFEVNQKEIWKCKDNLLKTLDLEILDSKIENITILLAFFEGSSNYSFNQLYKLRELSIKIISEFFNIVDSKFKSNLSNLLKRLFPELIEIDFEYEKNEDLLEYIENTFIKLKYDFSNIKKEKNIEFRKYLEEFKKSVLKDKEIYFYFKNQNKKQISLYELEKDKTIEYFNQNSKISHNNILDKFSGILDNSNLELFVKTLIKLKHIKGFLSELNFYPSNYIESELINSFKEIGFIKLEDFNYLPVDFIITLIKNISNEANYKILIGKEKKIFYILSNIIEKIREIAAKENCINLREYRENFTEKSFIKILKTLPKDYLTDYHKGSSWLTNIGNYRLKKELENSKIIGFFDIEKISEKLGIKELLLRDIFNVEIDNRSGIWNKPKDVFYYSRYLKEKIENINQIKDQQERIDKINELSRELNIDREHIIGKIDENIELIGEEIKNQDQIKISEYIEKMGMDNDTFIEYIKDLNLNYLVRGDFLIFNPSKIENAKKEIKQTLKRDYKSSDFISLGNFNMNSKIMKELAEDLQESGEIKGIIYEDEDIKFYTETGLRNMMFSNKFLFSFHDFFYGKTLNENEISILTDVFNEVYKNGKLKGKFDKETLTFASDEIVFANDYNTYLDEFESIVNNYIKRFNSEFKRIKPILSKDTTIIPKEIKIIQDTIDRINNSYIFWKNRLDAYITRVNIKLLKEQGISVKKYKSISYMSGSKKDVKSFAEDKEVKRLMDNFNSWISIFNKLELKYQNIIFYQKRLLNNPDDQESNQKLTELREELNLN